MRPHTLRVVLASPILAALALNTGCVIYPYRAEIEQHQTVPFDGLNKVAVDTRNGAIEVRCYPARKDIDVQAVKWPRGLSEQEAHNFAERIEVEIARDSADPTLLRAIARMPEVRTGRSEGARFRIIMPPNAELALDTSNGAITVDGCGKDANLTTSNGAISIASCQGRVQARTSNGPITANDIQGNIDAHSSNGAIELERVGKDSVKARTSNGRIRIVDAAGEATLHTSNGHIELRCRSLPSIPHIQVVTSNGRIEVEVPRTTNAQVDMSTSNGRVRADLRDVRVSDFDAGRSHLRARLNDGGGRIAIESSNGSVTLRTVGESTTEKPAPQRS